MRTLIAALLLFSASSVIAAPKDEDAIKAQVAGFIAAFNKGDSKATVAYFADDATLVNPVGIKGTGTAEIQKIMEGDMSTILKGATMEMKVVSFRSAGKDAAWAELEHTVNGAKGPDGKVMNVVFHVPCLFVKKNSKWLVAEARPYMYLPAPPPTAAK